VHETWSSVVFNVEYKDAHERYAPKYIDARDSLVQPYWRIRRNRST